MNDIKQQAVKGIFWSVIERFSIQFMLTVLGIVMARLLTPSDYGIVGMLAIFLAISQSIIDSGFCNALIRKPDRTEVDFSTTFYFNIVIGFVLYIVLFFTAPLIASFYKTPLLVPITRVISIKLILNSLCIVQNAKMTINVDFKTAAKVGLISTAISGVIGIAFAYKGYGPWALVWQTVISSVLSTALLFYYIKWKPLFVFSKKSFNELFSYGSKLLASGILDTIYKNIYTIAIGKRFSSADLGFYTKARLWGDFPSATLTGVFQRVLFPILSKIQNEMDRLQKVYRTYLKLVAFIIFPLMMGLCATAKPFVNIVLGEKWNGSVILLQLLCFSLMWYPVHSINLNLLQVKGRSDLFLRLEIIKKEITTIALIITIPISIKAMRIGNIVSSYFSLVINTYYTGKLISIGFFKQMKDLFPVLFSSVSMCLIVLFVSSFFQNLYIQGAVGVLVGVVYYLTVSLFLNKNEMVQLLKIIKRKKESE